MNKPNYDANKKNVFMSLGYIAISTDQISENLRNFVGETATISSVSNTIKRHYDEGEILYFEYDQNGDACHARDFDEQKTAVFAIETGYYNKRGNMIYAQYKKNNIGWMGVFFNDKDHIIQNMNKYSIGIMSFASFEDANKFINDLEEKLLPGETWKYSKNATGIIRRKTDFQILESYLATISKVLANGDKAESDLNKGKMIITESKDKTKYALFNTGLLDKFANDILIVGQKIRSSIVNPMVVKEGIREQALYCNKKPEMASFFNNVSEIVYDANVKVDLSNSKKLIHCIEDGINRNRFPAECVNMYNENRIMDIRDLLEAAISRATRIAKRNYKYVVPQYRSDNANGGKIQFLMPIYMSSGFESDKSPDFVLVLSEEIVNETRFYTPETVLELAWAYNNARVICKPENTWLNPDKIVDCEPQENED